MANTEEKYGQVLRVLLLVLVPLAGILGAYYSTKAALEKDIELLRNDLVHFERVSNDRMERIEKSHADDTDTVRKHVALGRNGLPHPQALNAALDELERRFAELEKRVKP